MADHPIKKQHGQFFPGEESRGSRHHPERNQAVVGMQSEDYGRVNSFVARHAPKFNLYIQSSIKNAKNPNENV